MCSSNGLSEFARNCISSITRDGLAEPALLLIDESVPVTSSMSAKLQKSVRLNGNLWHLQSKLFPVHQIPAYRTRPLDECIPGVERLVCVPEKKGKWSQYFRADDVAKIQSLDLDFILKFGFGIIRGAILQSARYGVWSFHHDDEEKYRGGPPGFWEVYQGDPVTGALLQRLTDRLDGGIVLKKCFVPTDGRSHRANLQRIQECSWHMVRWACLDVVQGRLEAFQATPSKTTAPIYVAPNDFQVARYWLRLMGNWIRVKLANQRIDEWNVGLVQRPQSEFLNPDVDHPIEWSPYREPGQMVADPFLLPRGESTRILVEEFNWSTEQGRISELRYPAGAGAAAASAKVVVTPIIDEGIHMSYPYTFTHEGAVYAVPESGGAKRICLYRLNESSGAWTRECILLDGVQAVDTTILQHGGRWWMMFSEGSGPGPWSLYLWHSSSLQGPWEPHIANPVKTDISSSRPAGNLFWHEGKLYRPAQDGRSSYGGALCINRVDEFSVDQFQEVPVRRIFPDPKGPYPDGLHTFSGVGNMTVVDGKKHVWPPGLLFRRQLFKRFGMKPPDFRYSKVVPADPRASRRD